MRCSKYTIVGPVLIGLGTVLLLSLIIPKCFWTGLTAVILIILGCLFLR